MNKSIPAFWAIAVDKHLERLQTRGEGLSPEEAVERLKRFGPNRLNGKKRAGPWRLFFAQFKSSIILILLFATGLSLFLHDKVDAVIILPIVLISGVLGFWQEKGAVDAVEKLLALVQIKVTVLRGNTISEVSVVELVPGDIVVLKAGDIIPADCLLVAADHLFIDEAMLTGESYPVEKSPGLVAADAPLGQRSNALWMGTHVQSGEAKALVIATGFNNPIDEAIRNFHAFDVKECRKLAEIPYDFYRKRLSMLISDAGASILITKGALTNVLAACTQVENSDGTLTAIDEVRESIQQRYEAFSVQGLRTLDVAYKPLTKEQVPVKDEEKDMRFLGFLTLFDPPKANCAQTIDSSDNWVLP